MKKSALCIIILAQILILTACQSGFDMRKYENSSEYKQYQEDYDVLDRGPVKGGTLNLFTTEPDSLNPVLTQNTYTADFLGFIYEGLTRLDGNQRAVPMLSDRWSVSSDGLIWTFHIRDGIRWHDGTPFTAYDVEFSIRTILNPRIDSIYKPLLLNISTYAAVDSSNIRIVLEKPNSFMPEMMTFPIIPKHQFEQEDVLSASEKFLPIGTGPYLFVSYKENDHIELELNKSWWYLSTNMEAGMYIETIMVKIYKHLDSVFSAFQSDDLDVADVAAIDSAKYKGRTDLTVKWYTSRNFEFLAFNLKNPVFSDYYARKAISMAIDIDELINEELLGEAERAEVPILPECWINDLDGISAAPLFNPDNDVNPELTAKTPVDALMEGGWKESRQGWYKSIGGMRRYLKVELLVNDNNKTRVRVAHKICEQITNAGINAQVKEVKWDDMMNRIVTAKFDIAFMGCRIPQIPDLSYLYSNAYLPSPLMSNADIASNISGYDNSQLSAGITELFREIDPNEQKRIYKALKDQVVKDSPYIGLYFLRNAMVYSKDIKGTLQPDTWRRYHDIYNWYKPEIP